MQTACQLFPFTCQISLYRQLFQFCMNQCVICSMFIFSAALLTLSVSRNSVSWLKILAEELILLFVVSIKSHVALRVQRVTPFKTTGTPTDFQFIRELSTEQLQR